MKIKKIDKNFYSIFDTDTGFYLRSGEFVNGKETDKDPFMASYPELLDVGIMETCVCANKCNVDCYQKAIDRKGSNMSLEDFESILKQSKGKLFQCLDEKEIVLKEDKNKFISPVYIGNLNIDDKIYCPDGKIHTVTDLKKSTDEVFEIKTIYGKSILATKNHRFPTTTGLKTVEELKIGDELYKINNINSNIIKQLDIVKMIANSDVADKFFISDTPSISNFCKKNNIKRSATKTLRISRIKDNLNEIDYSNSLISYERSSFKFKPFIDIDEDLMILLGHYVGNGSYRTYTISKTQQQMIQKIEKALQTKFPQFTYTKMYDNNVCVISLNSTLLHRELFDKVFKCRYLKDKQLPCFIFNTSYEHKKAFLRGYFCDGHFTLKSYKGQNNSTLTYGSITFNTSSEKLFKDICMLLTSINIDYNITTEEGKNVKFSKENPRIIHRKKRYRINITNIKEVNKIKDIVQDHYRANEFFNIVNISHNDKYLHNRSNPVITSIKKIGIKNVVDINIDSEDHLFITTNGFISHNCALGGAGDPDTHEHFEEILKLCKKYKVVPNFTTSGIAFTKEKAKLCKKYCGAVAVSEHNADYTERAINLLLNAGVKTNIHYVLSNKTIDDAIDRLKNDSFHKGINAVIFLLYKPIGLGKEENMLATDNPKVKEFFSLIGNNKCSHKIGFDSCSCPGIINYSNNVNLMSIDYCEGGRYSAYIDANMNMMPCSFANQNPEWYTNLRLYTIQEAWNNDIFNKFRYSLSNSCKSCTQREFCAGGCPLMRNIVLCNSENKDQK